MKPEIKFENGQAIVSLPISAKLDKDKDGTPSVEFESQNTLKFNGIELADEMLKDTKIGQYLKEKLGAKAT